MVGKIRLSAAPFKNHWWHVTLSVNARGLTTGPTPRGGTNFEITLNLMDNRLEARAGDGGSFGFALDDLAVADFYGKLLGDLAHVGVEVSIDPRPFDLDNEQPLDRNQVHRVCDREYVRRYWRVLAWVDGVFQAFAGRFNGKQSPVHLFWHSFDLAPGREGADAVTLEAYSHEIISFGFWPGDRDVREPACFGTETPGQRVAISSAGSTSCCLFHASNPPSRAVATKPILFSRRAARALVASSGHVQ